MPAGARLGPQDRYEIKRFLGKGGFGEAYLALDRQLQRECVIKRPWASDGSSETLQQKLRDRFRHEAQLLVRANTPGDPRIPDIYEYLEESGCLVMKYVVGSSLADLLRLQKRPFPLERALRYALEVCKALVYLHTHGPEPLLHRDIKPDNILLDERERLWLIDFGIGRVLLLPPQAGDAPSQGFGTLGYAPPEQWQGNAVPRSDVYALGATLFNLLTRAPPGMWYASPEQWHDKIPADVIRLLERCLSFEVDARPSVPELAEALTALIEPAARQMPPPPLPLLPPARDLVGRGLELEALAERLERHGAAVLTGMAGMGKTTVATALAHQLAHNRPVFWHSFHEDEPIDPILERLAAFLDHHGQPQLQRARQNQPRLAPELQFDTLVTLLRRRPAVLCCDDVHLVEKDTHIGALLRRLLAEADRGQLQVLIISRHLPTFAPAGTAVPLPGLRREEARALLASHRLSLAEPLADQLLAITEGNAQLLILAIGALLTSDDHRTLIEHLADTRDVATFLLDAIDVHLNDAEREVMCAVAALGDYPGTRDAITKLVKRGDCWRELDELSRRFLLHQRVGPRGAEYGQHAIVQAYYYKRLGTQRKALHQSAAVFYEREERDRMKAAHHYEQAGQVAKAVKLATSDVEGAINSGQARALARLLARIPAGRLAQDKAAALHTVRGELAALLGDYTLAREELTEALEAVPRDDDVRSAEAQARRYRLLAMVDERTGEYDRAEAACRSGLACVARPDVPYREPARLQIQLAQLLWRRHDLDGVEHACRYGLELLPREPAAPTERAELQQRVALVKGARGDYRGAIEGLENSLHRARRSGDRMLIAMILHNLGLYCQRMGQSEQALAYYTESLDLKEQVGDVAGRVRTLINRGGVYQEGGHYTVALDCFAEARMLCERHNLVEPLAEVAANLGLVCFMLKNLPGAEAHFAEALAIDSRLGNAAGMADTEYRLGDLHLAQGDPAAAEQHAERALALAKQIGSSIYSACALRVRGEALVAQGRLAEAAEALQQAEQYQRTVDDPYDLTLITLAQARLAAAAGDREAARALTTDGLAVAREYRLPYQIGLLEALEAQLAAPGEERWDEHNLP